MSSLGRPSVSILIPFQSNPISKPAKPTPEVPGLEKIPTNGIDRWISENTLSIIRAKFRARASKHERPGLDALAAAMVDPDIEVVLAQIPRSIDSG